MTHPACVYDCARWWISSIGKQWLSCRTGVFLAMRVLLRLFRRLLLEKLVAGSEVRTSMRARIAQMA